MSEDATNKNKLTIKLNLDTDEAMQKLDDLKTKLMEIKQLQDSIKIEIA